MLNRDTIKKMQHGELLHQRHALHETLLEVDKESTKNNEAGTPHTEIYDDLRAIESEIRRRDEEARIVQRGGGGNGGRYSLGDGYETTSAILRPDQSVRSYFQESGLIRQPEFADLGFGALVRSLVTGPRTDLERRALAEGSDSTGGVTVPDIVLARYFDALRAATVVIQAGAQTVPLTTEKTTVAKLTADAVAEWRLEGGNVAVDDPTFAGVLFTARSLAVIVKASRELLEDSLNIEEMLQNSFIRSMAVALDAVALNGSGTPPEPKGIAQVSGIGSVDASGALTSYDKLIDLALEVWQDNVPNLSAFVMHPRTAAQLGKLKQATELAPLPVPPIIAGIPIMQTTSIPINLDPAGNKSLVITGDFSKLLIGMRTSLRIEVLRELYAGTHEYGFVAHLRADVQVSHAEAFAKLHGIA